MLRQTLLAAFLALTWPGTAALAQELRLDSRSGRIDFAVGESVFFRTSGTFQRWRGSLLINPDNVSASRVAVTIETASVDTRDPAQDVQLRGRDFFDVERFPSLTFASTLVERVGARGLRITGDVTLRGITQPMVLNVEVERDGLQDGPVAARFSASGRIRRSQFGMTKYLDITGESVEIQIKADAVRP